MEIPEYRKVLLKDIERLHQQINQCHDELSDCYLNLANDLYSGKVITSVGAGKNYIVRDVEEVWFDTGSGQFHVRMRLNFVISDLVKFVGKFALKELYWSPTINIDGSIPAYTINEEMTEMIPEIDSEAEATTDMHGFPLRKGYVVSFIRDGKICYGKTWNDEIRDGRVMVIVAGEQEWMKSSDLSVVPTGRDFWENEI